MKKIVVTLSIFVSLFLVGCQQTKITTDNSNTITWTIETWIQETIVSNFEECVEAGFPIMESYPRQCNDGTNTYTEEMTLEDNEEDWLSWNNEEPTVEAENNNENTLLQEKIKAMIERRSQEQTETSTTETWTEISTTTNTTTTTQTNTSTYNDDEITEDDIQALENIIDEIISK